MAFTDRGKQTNQDSAKDGTGRPNNEGEQQRLQLKTKTETDSLM